MTDANARRRTGAVGCLGAPGGFVATGDAGEAGITFLDELRGFFACQNCARVSTEPSLTLEANTDYTSE